MYVCPLCMCVQLKHTNLRYVKLVDTSQHYVNINNLLLLYPIKYPNIFLLTFYLYNITCRNQNKRKIHQKRQKYQLF